MRFITRVKNESFDGWRFEVRALGVVRYCSIAEFGSEDAARAAALEYRDRVFPAGVPWAQTHSALLDKSEGVVGVSLVIDRDGPGGPVRSVAWSAQLGQRQKRRFSITRLGWRGAFLAACACRRDYSGYPVDPEAVTVPDMPDEVRVWFKTRRKKNLPVPK